MKSLHCSSTLLLAKNFANNVQCKETAKENKKAAKNDCENNKDDQDLIYPKILIEADSIPVLKH